MDRARLQLVMCRTGLFLVGVATITASLYPFRLDWPRRLPNKAQQVNDTLVFDGPGIAIVPGLTAARVMDALETAPVTLDLRIQAEPGQVGPARILTWSSSIRAQDVMVGQDGSSLVVRIRRTGSTLFGTPGLRVADVLDGRPRDVRISLFRHGVVVSVDGSTQRVHDPTPNAALVGWDPSFDLRLGNEHGGNRPWVGRIIRADLLLGSDTVDLVEASDLPPSFWRLPDGWTPAVPWYVPWDLHSSQVLHVVGFLGLGWLATRVGWGSGRLAPVATAGAGFALALFVAKFVVAGRHPSVADLLVDVGAVVLGAFLGLRTNGPPTKRPA